MKVENLESLKRKILQEAAKRYDSPNKRDNSVIVGYTASYALYVHEAPMKLKGEPRRGGKGAYWDPQGRAQNKFLEQPARELNNSGELGRIVRDAMKRGAKLDQALKIAGLRIQRESMKLVPVDTGNLKASAFTRIE